MYPSPERHHPQLFNAPLPRADRLQASAALVKHWDNPLSCRHGFGDVQAASSPSPVPVRETSPYTPADGVSVIDKEVFKSPIGGVTLAMYTSMIPQRFARAAQLGWGRDYSVYFVHLKIHLEIDRWPLQNLFQECSMLKFKSQFDAKKLTYEKNTASSTTCGGPT